MRVEASFVRVPALRGGRHLWPIPMILFDVPQGQVWKESGVAGVPQGSGRKIPPKVTQNLLSVALSFAAPKQCRLGGAGFRSFQRATEKAVSGFGWAVRTGSLRVFSPY